MDREHIEELVSAHLDGELEPGEEAELQALLRENEEARALLASYAAGREELGAIPLEPAPASLVTSTQARLSKVPKPVSRWSKFATVVGSLAAALAFFWLSSLVAGPRTNFYVDSTRLSMRREPDKTPLGVNGSGIALESDAFQGEFLPGKVNLVCAVDAGTLVGATLKAKLFLDFDGDGTYDFVEESKVWRLDDKPGYQTVATSFVVPQFEDLPGPGRVRLELTGGGAAGGANGLKFDRAHTFLSVPLKV